MFGFKKRAMGDQVEFALILSTYQHLRDRGAMPTPEQLVENTRGILNETGFKLSQEQEKTIALAAFIFLLPDVEKEFEQMAKDGTSVEGKFSKHSDEISGMLRRRFVSFPDT